MTTADGGDCAQLVLYSRGYCHLCEDMQVALDALRGEYRFDVAVLDVDADPALTEKYDILVPLLAVGEREICHYFLDEAAVRSFLMPFRRDT